jgi:nitronate monooxygenase
VAPSVRDDERGARGRTLLTELFGAGWPAPHRVVPNAATDHWLEKDDRGPALNRMLNRLIAPTARFVPTELQIRMARAQRPDSRLLGPASATADGPESLVDAGALYAGETVARIREIRPAAELVSALSP